MLHPPRYTTGALGLQFCNYRKHSEILCDVECQAIIKQSSLQPLLVWRWKPIVQSFRLCPKCNRMSVSVMLNMKHLMPGKEVRLTSEPAVFFLWTCWTIRWRHGDVSNVRTPPECSETQLLTFYHYAKKQNISKDIFHDIFSDVLHKKEMEILPFWHVTFYVKLSILSRFNLPPRFPSLTREERGPWERGWSPAYLASFACD